MNHSLFTHLTTLIRTLPNQHIPTLLSLLRSQRLTSAQKSALNASILKQCVHLRLARKKRVKDALLILNTNKDVFLKVCVLVKIYFMVRDRRFLVCAGVLGRKYGMRRVVRIIKKIWINERNGN